MTTTPTQMLDGRVAIVTGAGGGIGRDIALQMARHGARVIVNDIGASLGGDGRDDGPAQQVVAEIKAAGGEAVASTTSVSAPGAGLEIVQCAIDSFGRVDCVVNNAGILRDRMFHKMSDEEWQSVLDVHLHGSYQLSRAACVHMKAQASGSFVHMTSTSGLIGNLGQANYAAAKMAIVGLSKSIALDLARDGVRSNCIAPFAFSRMVSSIPTSTAEQAARVEKIKKMTPAKIAPLAVFLASESASDITGQIFAVRNNELFLMSQPRPLRSVHQSDGWTPESIASHCMPALRGSLLPLDRSADVFSWDPV